VALLRDVGFDAAFNYHTTPKEQALKDAATDGIDIYWCACHACCDSSIPLSQTTAVGRLQPVRDVTKQPKDDC
jgi:NADPH-dependent curcumin reductase CurA